MNTWLANLLLRKRLLAAFILGWMAVPSSSAVTQGGGASDWFRWTPSQRESFVTGWVRGLEIGFSEGCVSGFDVNNGKGNVDEDIRYTKQCGSRNPLQGGHPDLFAGQVTRLYRKYPTLRRVPVEEILSELALGHTVEQAHDHFTDHHN